jgi:hypothetical protein
VGGLVVSFAFLPNLKDRRFKAVRQFARTHFAMRLPRAAPREHSSCWSRNKFFYGFCLVICCLAVLYLFVGLPVWIWVWKLPRLQCPAAPGLL